MLNSPISVTIGTETYSLSRKNQDNYGAIYKAFDTGLEVALQIRHQWEKPLADGTQYGRHNVDLTLTTFDAEGKPSNFQAYSVIRCPRGTDLATIANVAVAMCGFASTNASDIVAWES